MRASTMNAKHLSIAILTGVVMLAGCQDKSAFERAEDKVNDALDRRPGEPFRDAAEDVGAAAKDFGSAMKDVAKDVAHEAKGVAKDVAKDAKEAARDLKESTR